MPGGNPVIAVPGLTPTSPVTSVGPVLVTVDDPRTAKVCAEPSWGCAKAAVALTSVDARTIPARRVIRGNVDLGIFMQRSVRSPRAMRCSIGHRGLAAPAAGQQRGQRQGDGEPSHYVADPAVNRAAGQEPKILGHDGALEHVGAL